MLDIVPLSAPATLRTILHVPPAPILTNADHFQFTNLNQELLDLFGTLLGWSDDVGTGVVEKLVVKRSGAIHQRIGAPPKRFEFRCLLQGPEVRARYQRICDVIVQEPEGELIHPRFGKTRSVCTGLTASETPSDSKDTIEFTIKFVETGLRDNPKPAPSALAQNTAAQGATIATESASLGATIASAGAAIGTRSNGLLIAMQGAETGSGTLLDVDASLSALSDACDVFTELDDVPQTLRRQTFLCFASALQARNSFIAGRPPIIKMRLDSPISLSAYCQKLYGYRALTEMELITRINRIPRPYAISAGTELLLTDPTVVVSE